MPPRLYDKLQPDLIHLNSLSLLGWGLAAKLRHIPVVCHVREPLADGYFGIRKKLMQHLTNWFSWVYIPICEHDAATLLPSDNIKVVYNFVDFQQFDRAVSGAEIRTEFGIDPAAQVVLFMGGFLRHKGIELLLRSVPYFLPENRVLIIAGDTGRTTFRLKKIIRRVISALNIKTFRQKIEFEIHSLQIEFGPESVLVVGLRKDIPHLLATCDLLIFPALKPHFGRPVIEAAAMAKPAVASNLGGLPELIDHEETGLLLPAHNPRILGEAVDRLLSDPEKLSTMGERAYQKAQALFEAHQNMRQLSAIYEHLLSENE